MTFLFRRFWILLIAVYSEWKKHMIIMQYLYRGQHVVQLKLGLTKMQYRMNAVDRKFLSLKKSVDNLSH